MAGTIDIEDPDGAAVICIALNKKNETAMKTGHLEIMNTMESLCNPDPHGKVPFEPVQQKLIEMYGPAADHPNLLEAFRFIIVQGGKGSLPLKDLAEFTSILVDQKKRKTDMKHMQKYPNIRKSSHCCETLP